MRRFKNEQEIRNFCLVILGTVVDYSNYDTIDLVEEARIELEEIEDFYNENDKFPIYS